MEASFEKLPRVAALRASAALADTEPVETWALWGGKYAEAVEALRRVDESPQGVWSVAAVRRCAKCGAAHYPLAATDGMFPAAEAAARAELLLDGGAVPPCPCAKCAPGAADRDPEDPVAQLGAIEAGRVPPAHPEASEFVRGVLFGYALAKGAPAALRQAGPLAGGGEAAATLAAMAAARATAASLKESGAPVADPAVYRKRLLGAVWRGPPAKRAALSGSSSSANANPAATHPATAPASGHADVAKPTAGTRSAPEPAAPTASSEAGAAAAGATAGAPSSTVASATPKPSVAGPVASATRS